MPGHKRALRRCLVEATWTSLKSSLAYKLAVCTNKLGQVALSLIVKLELSGSLRGRHYLRRYL